LAISRGPIGLIKIPRAPSMRPAAGQAYRWCGSAATLCIHSPNGRRWPSSMTVMFRPGVGAPIHTQTTNVFLTDTRAQPVIYWRMATIIELIRTRTATKAADPSAHHYQPRPHSSHAMLAPGAPQCRGCGCWPMQQVAQASGTPTALLLQQLEPSNTGPNRTWRPNSKMQYSPQRC